MNQFSYIVSTRNIPPYFMARALPEDTSVSFTSDALEYYTTNVLIVFRYGAKYVISINELDSDRYYLKEPIEVMISDLGDEILVEFPEAELSRSEETAIEAINWLKFSMVELYELFKKDDLLGPLPQKQLLVLEKYIGKKPYRAR